MRLKNCVGSSTQSIKEAFDNIAIKTDRLGHDIRDDNCFGCESCGALHCQKGIAQMQQDAPEKRDIDRADFLGQIVDGRVDSAGLEIELRVSEPPGVVEFSNVLPSRVRVFGLGRFVIGHEIPVMFFGQVAGDDFSTALFQLRCDVAIGGAQFEHSLVFPITLPEIRLNTGAQIPLSLE